MNVTTSLDPHTADPAGTPYKEVEVVAFEFSPREQMIRISYERGNTILGKWVAGRTGIEYLTLQGQDFADALVQYESTYAGASAAVYDQLIRSLG